MDRSDDTGYDPLSGRKGSWFQTFSQKRFFLQDPRADEVDPIDIAHHLSNQCRFNGACKRFYSVAEHCVRVSWAIEEHITQHGGGLYDETVAIAFWGLMHDATEAYVGDMVRPLKVHDKFFNETEAIVLRAVCDRFGMAYKEPALVRHFDLVMLATEKRDICTGDLLWSLPEDIKPLIGQYISGWNPLHAEQAWLDRFKELGGVL